MSLSGWLAGELRACVGSSAQDSEATVLPPRLLSSDLVLEDTPDGETESQILASCVEVCMEGDGASSTEERLRTVADLVEGETGTRPSRAFLEDLSQRWQHGNAASEKTSAVTTGPPSCPQPSKEGTHPRAPNSAGSRCAYGSRDTIEGHRGQRGCGGSRGDNATSGCDRGINSLDGRLVGGTGDKDDTPSTLVGQRSAPDVTTSFGVGAGTYQTIFNRHSNERHHPGVKQGKKLGTTDESGTRARSGRPEDLDAVIAAMVPGRGKTRAHPGSTVQPATRETQGRNSRRKEVGVKIPQGKGGLGGARESKGELKPQTRATPASVYASNEKPGAICISIVAKPNAKQSKIVGVADEAVDIQIGAPPRDGAANTELAGFLAEVCGVRRNRVSVAAGSRSRCKLVTVEGAGSAADVATKLEAALELS